MAVCPHGCHSSPSKCPRTSLMRFLIAERKCAERTHTHLTSVGMAMYTRMLKPTANTTPHTECPPAQLLHVQYCPPPTKPRLLQILFLSYCSCKINQEQAQLCWNRCNCWSVLPVHTTSEPASGKGHYTTDTTSHLFPHTSSAWKQEEPSSQIWRYYHPAKGEVLHDYI